jgi:CDP-glucose 4,6-dehydratase
MENVVTDASFWSGRRVFLTGHTGFKGTWMSLLLSRLGADVHGYALEPEGDRSIFDATGAKRDVRHTVGDVRDLESLQSNLSKSKPEIVIHMAAQSLVRASYAEPVATYATNVMGTVNVLEAVRQCPSAHAVIIITSDKCYGRTQDTQRYSENDRFGGRDPYSNSKGCAELVTDAYRRSFFVNEKGVAIASGRAGNVIGGGDWARDRLLPDAIRAFTAGETLRIRSPNAVRPWQHVLDPVLGYLNLAEHLIDGGQNFAEGWNFGPRPDSEVKVSQIIERIIQLWGKDARCELDKGPHPHEENELRLDCSKAESRLGWTPLFDLEQTLQLTVDWYRADHQGTDLRQLTLQQIDDAVSLCYPAGHLKIGA